MRNMYLVFIILVPLVFEAQAERPGYVTVLLYHRFDESRYPSTNISSDMFREQLEFLKREGYRVLSMHEFRQLLATGKPFPQKSVLITIDDPYRSIYEHAFPLLKEFAYPFTLFANTSPLYSESPVYMDWAMLEEIRDWGATIGNHSHFHPHMGQPEKGHTPEEYAVWVRKDLKRAQKAFVDHGIDTDVLAYPFGEYNETVLAIAKELGFELMFTQDEGGVDEFSDHQLIPRVAIVGANMSLERFTFKLNLAPLHVADVQPEAISLNVSSPEKLSLRLLDPTRYRPGIINMFLSEWDRVDAVYDAKTGVLSYRPDRPLTRPMNRLIVTAKEREGGHFSMFSRLYFRPYPEWAEE